VAGAAWCAHGLTVGETARLGIDARAQNDGVTLADVHLRTGIGHPVVGWLGRRPATQPPAMATRNRIPVFSNRPARDSPPPTFSFAVEISQHFHDQACLGGRGTGWLMG
jgi:hypothetical protein